MNKKSQITIGLALLIMASLFCGSVNAQVPVTDSQNTKSTIKNWFTNLKESKVVVGTMNTAKKTSAAIGTAKKAVSEYVLENKKKIEEKMAKVKEYKEKAEKYKEDYEKYKAQLDEGIAKAKEMKEQAEQGIQTAKDTAAAAKGVADAAKDKVNSKLGREEGTADGFVAENNVTENLSAAPDNGAQEVSAESSVSAGNAAAQPVVQAKPAVSQVVTSRRPFGSAAASVSGAVGTVSAGSSGTISAAVSGGQIAVAPSAVVKMDNAGIVPVSGAVASVEEAAVNARPQTMAAEETVAGVSGQAALQDAAVKDLTAAPAEMPAEVAQLSAGSQDKDAVAVAPDKAGAAAVSGADNKVIGGKTLSAAPAKAAAVRAVDGKAAVVQSLEIKGRPQAAEPMPAPAVRTLQAVPQQNSDKIKRKSLRRTFTTSSLEGFGQISGAAPVGFAYALELPDDCSDVNNTRVFPRTTCMYCGLSSSKAKSKGAIDECLLSINKESAKAQAYSGRDAPKAYRKGKLEIAAAMIAESYRAANKAETFYDNKVAPIAEAPEAVEQDALANLVEFNKVINEQLNDLMQLYSSKLTLQAYMNYGKYNFKPEEEEDEE